jgi:TonB family protein
MAHLWDVFYHSPMFDSWLGILLNTTIQGSVIIGAAIIVTVFWRNASASVRHCIAAFALVSLLIVPVTSVLMPSWGISLFTISYSVPAVPHVYIGQPSAYTGETQAVIISNEVSDIEIPVSSAPLYRATILSDILTTAKHIHWSVFLFLVWLSGVIYLLIRLLRSLLKIRFLTADARMLSDEQLTDCKRRIVLDKNIALAENASAVIPMTVGWRKPIILVPVGFTEWNAKQRESILLHELAHIKRNDCLTTALAVGAYIINWFNPLVWWTLHQFYLEREKACDDIVVSSGTKPAEYAGHLLELIRTTAGAKLSPVIMAFAAYNSFIPKRFSALFNTKVRRNRMNKKGVAGLCITTVCIISLFAGFKPFTNDARDNNDKAQKTVKQDIIPDVSTRQIVQKQTEITVPKVKLDYVPDYPDSIIKAGITGIVTVNVLINKEGIPIDFKVVNPNERLKELEKSVIEAVKKSRYIPATQSGKPIDYWMEKNFTFTSNENAQINLPQQKTIRDTIPKLLNEEDLPRLYKNTLMKSISITESVRMKGIPSGAIVSVLVNNEGNPVDFKVMTSAINEELDKAIIDVFKKARYEPAKQNGKPVSSWMNIPISLGIMVFEGRSGIPPGQTISGISLLITLENEQRIVVIDSLPLFLPEEDWPKFDRNELLKNIKYPESAIKDSIKRNIVVDVKVSKDGIPTEFKILSSPVNNKELETAIIDAIKQTKFTPATNYGKPITYWIKIAVPSKPPQQKEPLPVPLQLINPLPLPQQKTVKDTIPASLPKENQPRIGGFIDSLMKLIVWPESALKAGIKGNFVVGILLDKEGKPAEFKVLKSLGESEWDEAVIEALKKIKMIIVPITTQNLWEGIIYITMPITFDLSKIKDTNISTEIPVVSPIEKLTSFPTTVYNILGEKVVSPIEKLTSFPTEFSLPQQKKAVVDTIPAFLPEEDWPKFDRNELLKNIKYPELARLAGIQGEVIIDVLINKDGIPTEFKVLKSLGRSGCDESTIVGIKRTKFTPAIQNGKPVHFWIKIKVAFSLAKKGNITVGLLPLHQQKTVKDTIPAYLSEEAWPKFDRNVLMRNIKYPELARSAGIQGDVIIDVLIGRDGIPTEFKVLKSPSPEGNKELETAIIEGIKKTRFAPAQQNRKPVPFWIKIKVTFSLGKMGDIKAVQPIVPLPLLEQKTVKDTIPSILPEEDMPKIVGGREALLKQIVYPESALKAGIEGTVKVDVKINKDGRPSEIRILEPLEKSTELEIAVLQAIMKVKFIPAKYKGNPIDFWMPVTVTFEAGKIKGEKTTQDTSQMKAILPITEIPPFLSEDNWPKFSRDSLLRNVVYPESARKAGITGRIVIDTKIDRNGDPVEFKVINPQKKTKELEDAVIEGIKKVKFRPATSHNRPVAFWIKIAVTFELDVLGVIK